MNRWVLGVLSVAVAAALGGVAWAGEAKDPQGKALFLKYRCSSCHSIEAAGVVKKAAADEAEEEATSKTKPPDLSGVGLKKKAAWIALFLQKKEKLEGDLHPKKFRGSEKDLQTIAAWIETLKTAKAGKVAGKASAAEAAGKVEKASAAEAAGKVDSTLTAGATEKSEPAAKVESAEKPDAAEQAPAAEMPDSTEESKEPESK